MIRDERPDSIIVTLPGRFFKEYGMAKYLAEIKFMNEHPDQMIWYRVCKNLPKIEDLLYVYTIIDNHIHHRACFGGLVRNTDLTFPRPNGGSRTFPNANAIMMIGPIVMAPKDMHYRGFQGFRYVNSDNLF